MCLTCRPPSAISPSLGTSPHLCHNPPVYLFYACQVTDSDGTVHSYINDKQHYITTFKAKGTDDRQRAQWLAEAYEVPYTLPPAAPAAAPGPRIVSAQPAAASAPAAARSNGVPAPVTVARPPGIGGSWANVAKAANPLYQATTGVYRVGAWLQAWWWRVQRGPGCVSGSCLAWRQQHVVATLLNWWLKLTKLFVQKHCTDSDVCPLLAKHKYDACFVLGFLP